MRKEKQKGTITPALLIISGAFTVVIYALLALLTSQLDFSHRQIASETALNIAEAGVNYYKWHLAHAPNDFQDGTGIAGPYEHVYSDTQGKEVGKFSLVITPPTDGSSLVTIKSTGWTNQFPNIKRAIKAQYGKPSFAQYAFLLNASAWYGQGSIINGNIHSNNGIRMDGVNTGIVSSAQLTYMCGSETGCSPPTQRPGVWGAGGDQNLWKFPVPSIDFDAVSFDFTNMKTQAQQSGLYLGPSNRSGYHLIFLSNGSVTIKRVQSTSAIRGYRVPGEGLGAEGVGGCRNRNQVITSEVDVGTYNLNQTPIIFAEDHLWVEGTLNGRITVVAAGFPISSSNLNIWIRDNIQYESDDGSDSLGLIAQNDILLVRDLPDYFRMDGAFMAQKGQIIRHGYFSNCGGPTNAVRQKLTINGALISYNKSYWNYGTAPDSGFREREINYDSNLLYAPPPYFPTSNEYQFISWSEE